MNRADDPFAIARNLSRLYDEAQDRQRKSNDPCRISLKIEVKYLRPISTDTAHDLSM